MDLNLRAFFFLFFVSTTVFVNGQAPAISYATPQVYLTGTAISPLSPVNTGGAVPNSTPINYGPGFDDISGIAVDATGNVYVTDDGNNDIVKIPVGNGPLVTIASGFDAAGVAVDNSGNIYVADTENSYILEIPVAGGPNINLGSGLNNPTGVAVDAAGNVYVADFGSNTIKEIPTGNLTTIVVGSGFNEPRGVAVDASGNIYVLDSGNNLVKEIVVGSGNIVTLATGGGSLNGIAVDKNGNVYFADGSLSAVVKIPVGGGSKITVASNLFGPQCVAVDPQLTLYVGGNEIELKIPYGGYSINKTLPAGLSFDKTTGIITGTPINTAAAATYTVNAFNISGNSSTTINIRVNLPPKPVISYSTPQVYTTKTAIPPLSPANSGGAVYSETDLILSSVFNNPSGVALDASGNIYVAEIGNNDVQKIPAAGGNPTVVSSGFNGPTGLAVDASGNIYVADNGNKAVKEIPAGGGAVITISTGFASPYGIAVDAAGNLYVSDATNNNVIKIPAEGGSNIVIATGFNSPRGLATDVAGNVYVADSGNGVIKKILAKDGSVVIVASELVDPYGVAVDNAGNLYTADYDTDYITRFSVGGDPVIIADEFELLGLAVDPKGNVYCSNNNDAVTQITPGRYFIGPSLPAGLSFDNNTGIISGTPTTPTAATNYTVTAYNTGGDGTAVLNITVNAYPVPVISYKTPQVYLEGQAITPLIPGASGVASADTATAVLETGLSNPTGIAVDRAGNIYFTETELTALYEIVAATGKVVILGSGFSQPTGVALDAAGNIYVVDNGNNAVKKIPAGGGATIIIATGFNGPYGLAIDGAGNIYVGDANNNEVKKIPAGSSTPVIIGSGFNHPTGVAVDEAGNVYVADRANNAIKKILATDGSTVTIASGDGNPNGVAVDSQGNIYFADTNEPSIIKIPINGSSNINVGSGLGTPAGLAIDATNAVYVADPNDGSEGSGIVEKINRDGGFYISPALPAGLSIDDNTGTIRGTPTVVSPATNYTVSAYNIGGSGSSTVNISVLPNANLSNLTLSHGTLSPTFATAATAYTTSVANTTSSIIVTPTATDANATIKVNGTAVTSGTASAAIPLNAGPNTITTIVTAQDGTTTKTYTVTVTRAPSSEAYLANLTLQTASLSPSFADNTLSYTASVAYGTTSVTVTPTTSDANATVTVNGTAVTNKTASGPIALSVGANPITIVVTAQDGVTTKTYTVTVTRAPSSDAHLTRLVISSGTLSPAFSYLTTSYTASVNTAAITVTPTTGDANATVKINGTTVASNAASKPINLATGTNTITTIVTAQDGTTTDTYTITVTRLSSVATLSALKLSSGALSPAFASGTAGYTASVTNATSSITVTPTTGYASATVKINGTAVANKTASGAIALSVGANNITIVVTAQDGVTKQTYTVTVTRAPSSEAYLATLTVHTASLSPSFAYNTLSYTAGVAHGVTSVTVTPAVIDLTAKVTVNGTAVANKTASGAIALSVGANPITIVVTAQDGVTRQTYTVTVTRAPSSEAYLASLTLQTASLSPSFAYNTLSYTAGVANSISSVTVTPAVVDLTATVKVNGTAVANKTASGPVMLSVGANPVTIVVTAQDGVTKQTYTVTVTRAAPGNNNVYEPVSVTNPNDNISLENDGIMVHQAVSPNGDGINDFLTIDNIANYPDNHLMIMNRNGMLVYEAKGYDNSARIFDGHSNKTGQMQLPGTYFYSLDYTVKGIAKHKTGFIVLKY